MTIQHHDAGADLLVAALRSIYAEIETKHTNVSASILDLEEQLADKRATAAQCVTDMGRLAPVLNALTGAATTLTPQQVTSDTHGTELRIGWLRLGVDRGASPDDLQLYAAVMREIQYQALHQATVAVAELNRRQEHAGVDTGRFPMVTPNGAGEPPPGEQGSAPHRIAGAYGDHADHGAGLTADAEEEMRPADRADVTEASQHAVRQADPAELAEIVRRIGLVAPPLNHVTDDGQQGTADEAPPLGQARPDDQTGDDQ